MRVSTLTSTCIVVMLLCFGSVCGRVFTVDAAAVRLADAAVAAADLLGLTLAAATKLSFERGPTNAALGADTPLPADRSAPLAAARAATDIALDAVSARIGADAGMLAADIPHSLAAVHGALASVRHVADALLERPLAARTGPDVEGVVSGLVAVIPLFSPALNAMEATLARAEPQLTGMITAARLATEMRDYAGRLGSVFTAPLIAHRPMTQEESVRLERIAGHLDALHDQFIAAYTKLPADPAIDAALAETDAGFFGAGRVLVDRIAQIGRATGAYDATPASFAAAYVPQMSPLVALRDAAVANCIARIGEVRARSVRKLALSGGAVAMALCVVLALYSVLRRRVLLPLLAMTHAIGQIARRSYDVVIPDETQLTEIRQMRAAIEQLRNGAIAAAKHEAQVAHMARHDPLTGLPNRTLLYERTQSALALAKVRRMCAALYIDLDRFKHVNDTLGHQVGDELLRAVAERLISLTRAADTVARLGGDEFAVLQVDIPSAETADTAARRVVESLKQPYDLAGHRVVIGASVGVALGTAEMHDVETLLRNADLALQRAKKEGKNRARFFDPDMDAVAQARRQLETDLRAAMATGEFELHFQPQISVQSGRIAGFEALIRWLHPQRGLVPPDMFIPLAEEIGLIKPIGAWVLQAACREACRWPAHVSIALNLSALQFTSSDVVDQVGLALESTGLAAGRLEIEITETALLHWSQATFDTLRALRSLGVRIALDDFGTGASSLSNLRLSRFDKLKIDRSFIADLDGGGESLAIVRAVCGMGRALATAVTAEGVETERQMRQLVAEGCTELQGYFFSPPCRAQDVPRLLADIAMDSCAA